MSEASPHVDASEAGQKCADLLNNSLLSSLFTSVLGVATSLNCQKKKPKDSQELCKQIQIRTKIFNHIIEVKILFLEKSRISHFYKAEKNKCYGQKDLFFGAFSF